MPGLRNPKNLVLLLALSFTLSFYVLMAIYLAQANIQGDFAIFYASARNFFQGKDIYSPVPIDEYGVIPPETKELFNLETFYPNLNPPFQTLLFLPFAFLPIKTSFLIWSFLSILMGLACARLIGKAGQFSVRNKEAVLLIALLMFAFFPTIAAIGEGQITFLALLVVTVVWVSSRSGNDRLAGIVLGVGISIKVFFGLFLLFFLVQRRFKLLAWCLATWLITSLLALLVFGIAPHRHYLEILGQISWYSYSWNASFVGYFSRLLETLTGPGSVQTGPALHVLVYTYSLLSIALLAVVAWPHKNISPRMHFDLGFGITVVLMLLVSPFGWLYYFPLLIIPTMVLIGYALRQGQILMVFLVITLWVIQAVLPFLPRSSDTNIYIHLQLGYYTYYLVLLSVLITWRVYWLNRKSAVEITSP